MHTRILTAGIQIERELQPGGNFSPLPFPSCASLFILCACVELSGRIISVLSAIRCVHTDAVPEAVVEFIMTYNCLWLWETSVFWQGWPLLLGFRHSTIERHMLRVLLAVAVALIVCFSVAKPSIKTKKERKNKKEKNRSVQ